MQCSTVSTDTLPTLSVVRRARFATFVAKRRQPHRRLDVDALEDDAVPGRRRVHRDVDGFAEQEPPARDVHRLRERLLFARRILGAHAFIVRWNHLVSPKRYREALARGLDRRSLPAERELRCRKPGSLRIAAHSRNVAWIGPAGYPSHVSPAGRSRVRPAPAPRVAPLPIFRWSATPTRPAITTQSPKTHEPPIPVSPAMTQFSPIRQL